MYWNLCWSPNLFEGFVRTFWTWNGVVRPHMSCSYEIFVTAFNVGTMCNRCSLVAKYVYFKYPIYFCISKVEVFRLPFRKRQWRQYFHLDNQVVSFSAHRIQHEVRIVCICYEWTFLCKWVTNCWVILSDFFP